MLIVRIAERSVAGLSKAFLRYIRGIFAKTVTKLGEASRHECIVRGGLL